MGSQPAITKVKKATRAVIKVTVSKLAKKYGLTEEESYNSQIKDMKRLGANLVAKDDDRRISQKNVWVCR